MRERQGTSRHRYLTSGYAMRDVLREIREREERKADPFGTHAPYLSPSLSLTNHRTTRATNPPSSDQRTHGRVTPDHVKISPSLPPGHGAVNVSLPSLSASPPPPDAIPFLPPPPPPPHGQGGWGCPPSLNPNKKSQNTLSR